jgi:hypothetical protein
MSRKGKILGYGLGALPLIGGLAMFLSGLPGGIGPTVIGAIVIAAIALEPRYGRPTQTTPAPQGQWERTGERFVDDECKQLIEVWYNPATGQRRYTEASD